MKWLAVALTLLVVPSCANLPSTRDEIVAEGFQLSDVTYVTVAGERRKVQNYELWVRTARTPKNTLDFCIVPLIGYAGYTWRLTVFVDDGEAWSYESRQRQNGIDCVTTPVLRNGRQSWTVNYMYWH